MHGQIECLFFKKGYWKPDVVKGERQSIFLVNNPFPIEIGFQDLLETAKTVTLILVIFREGHTDTARPTEMGHVVIAGFVHVVLLFLSVRHTRYTNTQQNS